MKSLPLGLLILLAVFGYSLAGSNVPAFLNAHAMVLVFVGTLGVLAVSTPGDDLRGLVSSLLALRHSEVPVSELNDTILALARRRDSETGPNHPLLDYARELWAEGVDSEIFAVLLHQRMTQLSAGTEQAVATLRNLAKYPPALGMTGTVIGLVTLFSGLTADSRDKIGPSLALAMTATFYGLVVANGLLMPLADRLHLLHLGRLKTNEYLYRALLLIHEGQPTGIIEENLYDPAA